MDFSALSELEQSWLYQGDLMRTVRDAKRITRLDVAKLIVKLLNTRRSGAKTRFMLQIRHYETGRTSGRSIIPLLLRVYELKQPPNEYEQMRLRRLKSEEDFRLKRA